MALFSSAEGMVTYGSKQRIFRYEQCNDEYDEHHAKE